MPESPGQTPYKELLLPQNLSPLQLLAQGRFSSSSSRTVFQQVLTETHRWRLRWRTERYALPVRSGILKDWIIVDFFFFSEKKDARILNHFEELCSQCSVCRLLVFTTLYIFHSIWLGGFCHPPRALCVTGELLRTMMLKKKGGLTNVWG